MKELIEMLKMSISDDRVDSVKIGKDYIPIIIEAQENMVEETTEINFDCGKDGCEIGY